MFVVEVALLVIGYTFTLGQVMTRGQRREQAQEQSLDAEGGVVMDLADNGGGVEAGIENNDEEGVENEAMVAAGNGGVRYT